MNFWLYQMTTKEWSIENYRLAAWEGKTLDWTVGKIYNIGKNKMTAGDKIVLFFCKKENREPGIYGLGEIKSFTDSKNDGHYVKFLVKPPTELLKRQHCWNKKVEKLTNKIRGKMKQGTLWRMTLGEYKQLHKQIIPKTKLDRIEQKILKALHNIHEPQRGWTDKEWTFAVKKCVAMIGRRYGFKVSGIGLDQEFIFDLCWREKVDGIDRNMSLAMESEWSPTFDKILEDFQKLIVSRADHRLLVCRQKNFEDWADCLRQLVVHIRCHHATQDNDRYLFACRIPDGWQFRQYPTVVDGTRVWLFQAVNDYDLRKKLKQLKKDNWEIKCHRAHLQAGDIALLWQAGTEAGIYGIGELTSGAYLENKKWQVKIRYNGLLEQPIYKPDILDDSLLNDMGIIKMAHNRNPFRVRDKEWQVLKKLIGTSEK